MWHKNPVVRNPEADYDLAASHRSAANRALIEGLRTRVLNRYTDYPKWREAPWEYKDDPLLVSAEKKALIGNYDLLSRGRPMESLRDEILASARNGLCALCGRNDVSTIDHFLPKERFPEYSILIDNLIAACPRCNQKKRDGIGEPGRRYIYPTPSPSLPLPLLTCVVTVEAGATYFDFEGNGGLSSEVRECVEFHLDTLELRDSFSTGALNELLEKLDLFQEEFALGGTEALLDHLNKTKMSITSKFGLSFWKVAVYDGLINCEEFTQDPILATSRLV